MNGNIGYNFNSKSWNIGVNPSYQQHGMDNYTSISPNASVNINRGRVSGNVGSNIYTQSNGLSNNLNFGVYGIGAHPTLQSNFNVTRQMEDGGELVDRNDPKYTQVNAKKNPDQRGRVNAMVKFFKERGVDPNFMDTITEDEFNDIFYLFGKVNGDELMKYCQSKGWFDKNRQRSGFNDFKKHGGYLQLHKLGGRIVETYINY